MSRTEIETTTVVPTKDMPLELYRQCHHLATYMELMERVGENRVIWDSEATTIYSEQVADGEYYAMHWNVIQPPPMELPKVFVDKLQPQEDAPLFQQVEA